MNTTEKNSSKESHNDAKVPEFLNYPPSEDIYRQGTKEEDIDPSDTSRLKQTPADLTVEDPKELDFNKIRPGSDLDIPGAELDDDMEDVGSEDEENNYYSIGGDNHDDLEENKGENDL